MINREYFIKIEVKPQYRERFFNDGCPIVITSTLEHKSLLPQHDDALMNALDLVVDSVDGWSEGKVMVTAFNRL